MQGLHDPALALALESGKPFKNEEESLDDRNPHNSSAIDLELEHGDSLLMLQYFNLYIFPDERFFVSCRC